MNRTINSILPLTFVTIVDHGSITKAADELNLAKSAVSQNLKRLEGQLGVQLAVRTTRNFGLTPAGGHYYLRCKEMLTLAKMTSTEMETFGATPSGPITITAPHALISPVIAPAVFNLVKKYPGLKPNIIADDKRLDLITTGIDVAITVGPLEDSNLKVRKIGVLRDVLCISKDLVSHIDSGITNQSISKIQALPYISHAREHASIVSHRLVATKERRSVDLNFGPKLFGNTVEAVLALVREGLGIAILPEIAVANDLKSGELVRVLPKYSLGESPIQAVHAYDTQTPKSVLETIEAVRTELNK